MVCEKYGTLFSNDRGVGRKYRGIVAKYRVYLNDRSGKVLFQKPHFEICGGELLLQNVPVNAKHMRMEEVPDFEKDRIDTGGKFPGLRNLINKAGLKDVVQKIVKYQPLPEYKNNGSAWLLMKTILLKWFSELNKPLLLIPLPSGNLNPGSQKKKWISRPQFKKYWRK
jgi:hypothetical protein